MRGIDLISQRVMPALVLAVLLLTLACTGSELGSSSDSVSTGPFTDERGGSVGATTVAAESSNPAPNVVSGDVSDSHWGIEAGPEGQVLWGGFAMPAAVETIRFASLAEIVNSSTVVVLAEAVGRGPSLELGGDPRVPADKSIVSSIEVRVLEVLAGSDSIAPGSTLTITGLNVPHGRDPASAPAVLFLVHHRDPRWLDEPDPSRIDDPIDRAALTERLLLWRDYSRDKYRLVNSKGVFVNRDGMTWSPTSSDDPVVVEVSSVPWSQFATRVEEVSGRPELGRFDHTLTCCDAP
jgi:hypothetical protein